MFIAKAEKCDGPDGVYKNLSLNFRVFLVGFVRLELLFGNTLINMLSNFELVG